MIITFQKTGYTSKSLVTDIALGIFDGIDNSLWAYGFAAIIFAGVLSEFMPVMLVILLVGWSFLGLFIARPPAFACTSSTWTSRPSSSSRPSLP
jgi:hypothetical protein